MNQLSPENQKVLLEHIAAEKVFDMERTLATLTNDCVFEDVPTGGVYRGREQVRQYYQEWWQAFGNVSEGGTRYVVNADTFIVETRFVGKHVGSFQGIPASGRPINLPISIFVGFRGGLMSGERFYYDRATLIDQISSAPI